MNKIKLHIVDFSDKQREIAEEILNSTEKFHSINASRQSGKTYLISRLAVAFAMSNVKERILVASPNYSQVKIIFDNILAINGIDTLITNLKSSAPYSITFVSGTTVNFRSAEKANTLRGGSNKVVILDEFSFFRDGVLDTVILQTTAAKKNSKVIITSTPLGKSNDFYRLAMLGMTNSFNYKYYRMHYTDNPNYDLSDIEYAKKRIPTKIYLQEYEAEFIDDGSDVFDNINNCKKVTKYLVEPIPGHKYYAGIDWGRLNDRTVLTIKNQLRQVVFIKSWVNVSWDKIFSELGGILNKFKPITYAESNGVGDVCLNGVKVFYSNVKPFYTSNESKQTIVEELRSAMISELIELPTSDLCPILYEEMDNYTGVLTPSKKIRYTHKPGKHDDHIDSLAIANYAYKQHNNSFSLYTGESNSIY